MGCMTSSVVLTCLAEAFNYNPAQARTPAGQKGGGRWSKSGVSKSTGHDLWIMNDMSGPATARAAYMTGAKGWDAVRPGKDDWSADIARNLLQSIHKQKVRTTPAYSGHGQKSLSVGDEIEIPLMATTPSKPLARAYSEMGQRVRGPSSTSKRLWDAVPWDSLDQATRDQLRDQLGAGSATRVEQFLPVTVYKFASNKSVPIRSNERVTSGRYRVTNIENVPDSSIKLWDKSKLDFVPGHSQEVTLEFVSDLPIVGRKDSSPE